MAPLPTLMVPAGTVFYGSGASLLETDRHRFVETDTDIFKIFSLIFGRFPYSIGH